MTTIILILLFAVALAALGAYNLRRSQPDVRPDHALEPTARGGLFDNPETSLLIETNDRQSALRNILLERAAQGDESALDEAHAKGNAELYDEVLDALIDKACARQEDFRALVSHISKSDELRGSVRLAERVIEEWKQSPDRRSTIEMLHIAALSDDAATYHKAIETVFEHWQAERLAQMSADDLSELIESQYWLLSSEARASGAGFALKQRLADVRRKLATATPAR